MQPLDVAIDSAQDWPGDQSNMVNRLPPSPTPTNLLDALKTRGWKGNHEALLNAAEKAAGADGRISRVDAQAMPQELREAFQWLRGDQPRKGVISDIDKTLLPKHRNDQPKPAPYPGARELLSVLDERHGDPAGDVFYVTARDEKRLRGMDLWMRSHDMPKGPVEGGVGGEPWLAKPEKIQDIERILADQPATRFILIGDNNHVDHEVFADIMSRFPDRIEAALIHRIKPHVGVADGIYLFEEHAEAARYLGDRGLLTQNQVQQVEDAVAPSR